MRWFAAIAAYIALFLIAAYIATDTAGEVFVIFTAVLVAVGVVYALTRFVAWAARR